jgi:hypothetical protein
MASIPETDSSASRRRRSSTWSDYFSARQPLRYVAESNPLPVASGKSEVDAFIRPEQDVLSPPCFNWKPLYLFLQRNHLGELTGHEPCYQLSKLCLVDDRSSSSGESESSLTLLSEHRLHSKDEDPTIRDSPRPRVGDTIFRKNLDEIQLYNRLLEKVSTSRYPIDLVTTCIPTRDRTFMPTDESCRYPCGSEHSRSR